MEEYKTLPGITDNMAEKDCLLGRITRAKRVFPKDLKALESFLQLAKMDLESDQALDGRNLLTTRSSRC